jgi:hypothetical protein
LRGVFRVVCVARGHEAGIGNEEVVDATSLCYPTSVELRNTPMR